MPVRIRPSAPLHGIWYFPLSGLLTAPQTAHGRWQRPRRATRGVMKDNLRRVVEWMALVTLWVTDALIQIMLITRSNERRIRPTKRVSWPKGLKQSLMKRQGNTCVYCGHRRIARSMDIDHMVPVVRGGSNDMDNLQVICSPCNQRKGDQTDEEFRARYSSLVPQKRLTPPRRRISQAEFRAETQRTEQSQSVQEFRRRRFISNREKVTTGSVGVGAVIGGLVLYGLASWGAEGWLLLLPSLLLGGAVFLGIWWRAYVTGAMVEDDD